nr:hypothetical protein [Candidatus Enterousia merdequi]
MMKSKISFLAMIAIALNANCVYASECIDDDCDLETTSVEQDFEILEIQEPVIKWVDTTQYTSCEYDYNCPFESAQECAIWHKKPSYKTIVEPRAPHINPVLVDDMLYAIYSDYNITANDSSMAPLLQRYKMLMNASQSCCTSGMVYKMQQEKFSETTIYKFLKDDVNYFATTVRCMVIPDDEIADNYSYGVHGQMVADVRNACLCKNRKWFETLLQPFVDIYEREPRFKDSAFTY